MVGNNGYVWISAMDVDQEEQILLNPRDEPAADQEKDRVRDAEKERFKSPVDVFSGV